MLYIAYGSNCNRAQMLYRCKTAKPYGVGYIENWKLDFHGTDGTAYATITRNTGSRVPVVLWEMSKAEEKIMDMYEGYPNSYYKQKIAVYTGEKKKFGIVYIMNSSRPVARPSRKYVNTIRQGYDDFGIDIKFLDEALKRNSADFYQADILEVRELTRFGGSYSKGNTKKKSGKEKKDNKKSNVTYKTAKPWRDVSIWKEESYEKDYSDIPGDMWETMKPTGFDDYATALDFMGGRKPSISDYDEDYE